MTQFKFKVLGGAHYPKPDECFINNKSVSEVKKGDVFTTFIDLRKQYPNRFELISESEVELRASAVSDKKTATPAAPTAEDEFPTATAAGLTVKAKKVKDKGIRFFVYGEDPETPLNKKSLAKEDVAAFVADHTP